MADGDPKRPIPIKLEDFLPYRLSVLANIVSRGLAQAYIDRFGLTVPEWRVMAVLARFAPLSAGEVADRSAMDKVRVSRAVARLIRAGLLARRTDDADRRRSSLELSGRGWEVYAEIAPAARRVEADLYGALNAEERAEFDRILAKLQRYAERYPADDAAE